MALFQKKRLIFLSIFLIGLLLFFFGGIKEIFNWNTFSKHYVEIKFNALNNVPFVYVVFVLVYFLTVAFSLPIASLLTIGGGAIFGWPAALLVILGASGGSCVVFISARYIFKDLFYQHANQFFIKLERGFSKDAFTYLMGLRLLPVVPFWALNIIPALVEMRLATFFNATLLGIIPGTIVYTSLGRSFDIVLSNGKPPDPNILSTPNMYLTLLGLSFLLIAPYFSRAVEFSKKSMNKK